MSDAPEPGTTLRTTARTLFWLTLALIAFVTLSPIALRPETPFGPNKERFVAFAIVSTFLVLGYPRHRLAGVLALVAAAALLEASQTLVAGRHGRFHDVEVKLIGAAAGALFALVIERAMAALRSPQARRRLRWRRRDGNVGP